jgi:UDP-GlcNAc:undecaprenyl-phosphate/decaprenyl-phosphate GlcNAc-1-phosphate transferase
VEESSAATTTYSIGLYHFDMQLFINFFVAFLGCSIAVQLLLTSNLNRLIVDLPNERSLHVNPTPRMGGVGILIGLACSALTQLFFGNTTFGIALPLVSIYLVLLITSLIDDIRSIPVSVRLTIHVGSVIFWVSSQYSGPIYITIGIILGITWAINLYNFMDGSDGLAGGITFMAFLAYGISAFIANNFALALTCFSVSGAALGFLRFNWPPSKIFLGDAGSIPLGFLAAAIGTLGVVEDCWRPTFPLMLFAMFWIDATYTLLRRAFRREKVWKAHNEHWYQKAIRAGNSHRKVLLIHLTCNTVIACLALLSTLSPTFATPLVHILTIGAVIAIAFGFGVWAESQFRGFQAKQIK